MPKSMSEPDDHQDSKISAGRASLVQVGRGLPYGELGDLSMRLVRRLGELEPAAVSVAWLCFKKPKWLVVTMFTVVKNGGLLAVILVKRLETTATNNPDQQSLQRMRSPVKTEQLLTWGLDIDPGSVDVSDSVLSGCSSPAGVMPTVSAVQYVRLRELAQSLRTEAGWYQDLMLLSQLAVGISSGAFEICKPIDSTLIADLRRVQRAQFCRTTAAATKPALYRSDILQSSAIKRDARIRNPTRIIDTHVLQPGGQGSVELPDLAAKSDVTTFTCPGSHVILTAKHKVLVIEMRPMETLLRHKFFANIFATLDVWQLPVYGIATSAAGITVSLHSEVPLVRGDMKEGYEITDNNLNGAVQDLRRHGSVNFVVDMAIVSAIDRQKTKNSVFAGDVFSTLENSNINITMISHGASDGSISCVIEDRDVRRAIGLLYEHLFPTEILRHPFHLEAVVEGVQ